METNAKRQQSVKCSIRPASQSADRKAPVRAIAGTPQPLDVVKIKAENPQLRLKAEFDLWRCTERYVTPAELARYWRVSTDTIYRDIKKGALPAFRVGSSGALRIRIEEARRYGRPGG